MNILGDILRFWFFEAPKGMIGYFSSFNTAMLKVLSFQILAATFFKPWKNEYREGLVGFSIAIGIVTKSFILLFDLLLLTLCIGIEILLVLAFLAWPFFTLWLFVK